MVSSPTPIRFDVYRGEQLLHSETIAELIIKIGSAASSHLRLEDEAASRLHAMVEVNALGEIHIADLGSRTGTFVNGEKSQRARLHSGDEVRIGETRIVVAMGPAATPSRGDFPRPAETQAHLPGSARAAAESISALGAAATPAPRRNRRVPLLILVAVLLALLAGLIAYQAARAQPALDPPSRGAAEGATELAGGATEPPAQPDD